MTDPSGDGDAIAGGRARPQEPDTQRSVAHGSDTHGSDTEGSVAQGSDRAGLAEHVRAMGRGPGRARSLERDEAADAMRRILDGSAAPEAVGALLMLMRYRGETAGEIAGFVDAARARAALAPWSDVGAAVDWPSYAAGRSRGLPWFLLSAKLVADAGAPVLLHGWNSHQNAASDVRAALSDLEIPMAETPRDAAAHLAERRIVYAPLQSLEPRLMELLRLRDVLGLRSAINTVLRVLNPSRAASAVQGVFHPPYRELQRDAGALLGQSRLTVLKGGGGEFERHPGKTIDLFGLRDGAPMERRAAPLLDETRKLADPSPDPERLPALWRGALSDPFAEAVVVGTAALALEAAGLAGPDDAQTTAQTLWRARGDRRAA